MIWKISVPIDEQSEQLELTLTNPLNQQCRKSVEMTTWIDILVKQWNFPTTTLINIQVSPKTFSLLPSFLFFSKLCNVSEKFFQRNFLNDEMFKAPQKKWKENSTDIKTETKLFLIIHYKVTLAWFCRKLQSISVHSKVLTAFNFLKSSESHENKRTENWRMLVMKTLQKEKEFATKSLSKKTMDKANNSTMHRDKSNIIQCSNVHEILVRKNLFVFHSD